MRQRFCNLAEGEPLIWDIAKTVLEMFGFIVLDAVNGKEALGLYKENTADIILVLTDGYAGYRWPCLFHALKHLGPTLPIIIPTNFIKEIL